MLQSNLLMRGAGWRSWVRAHRVRLIVTAVVAAGLAIGSRYAWHVVQVKIAAKAAAASELAKTSDAPPTEVHLPAEKLATAGLEIQPVARQSIQDVRTVPGRIGYHPSNRLQVNSPVAGVVSKVLVATGDAVKAGQHLAVLASEEIGLARDDLATREAELRIAAKEHRWTQEISQNIESLLMAIKARPGVDEIEKQFRDQLLGDFRDPLMSSYARLFAADRAAAADTGSLSVRLVDERIANRQVALSAFVSACEQSRMKAQLQHERNKLNLAHAERLLHVSQRRLATLLGSFGEAARDGDDACELILKAPQAAVVEERLIVDSVRVVAGQHLLTLTNTNTLWVSAEIYEHDWLAIDHAPNREVLVRPTAIESAAVKVKVQFVGLSVSTQSRTVPVVAELPNTAQQFKPGMFVRVAIPVGSPREALAVPPEAVMQHEGASFVFIAEKDSDDTFRRVDVQTGLETPEAIEITHGLREGDRIVSRGAFVLKSELLLEREE